MLDKVSFLAVVSAVTLCGGASADVSISSKPTQNMSCDVGVCTATAAKAVLNVADLQAMLASGDVAVKTGSLAKDIEVAVALSWTNTSRLTLDAFRSITVRKPITVAGEGAVTITTNDGGSGGDLLFEKAGSLAFWDTGSSLVINGSSYALVTDIVTLAADITANPSGLYALANDYEASVDGVYTQSPITTELQGTFEGLGHAVSNLTISTMGILKTGMFAQIAPTGTVRDLDLRNVNIVIQTNPDGALVGSLAAENDGTIHSVGATGSVSGGQSNALAAGGLVGLDTGSIVFANIKVHVKTGANLAGGLAGLIDGSGSSAQLSQSSSTGNVTDQNNSHSIVGGLVGDNNLGFVQMDAALGAVTGNGISAVGGLIGINSGTVDQSFATGAVRSGHAHQKSCYGTAGGLIGLNEATISNSYASGSAAGADYACVGGLIGSDQSSTAASYAIGHVSGGSGALIGGFAGKFNTGSAMASDCYWDIETTGTSAASGNKAKVNGITGMTTLEFQAGLPKGFDSRLWGEDSGINGGFPYLRANPPK